MRMLRALLFPVLFSGGAVPLAAQQTHVLIISGLSAEPQFRRVFQDVVATLVDSAKSRWHVKDSSLVVLAEDATFDPVRAKLVSNRESVAAAFAQLSKRVAPGDIVLILLLGHGGGEGANSRVNLPGPDPTAADYNGLLTAFAKTRVVFVNAASASGDFVPMLAAPGRVVITATKTAIEKNETVFAKLFVRGLTTAEADADKDGSISVFEAFDYARKEVVRLYDESKKMLTEHALVSDTSLAKTIAFNASQSSRDPKVVALIVQRRALEDSVAALRASKGKIDEKEYSDRMEGLLIRLAEKSAAVRAVDVKP